MDIDKVVLDERCLPPEKGIDNQLSENPTVAEALFHLCFQAERFTKLELHCLWYLCATLLGYPNIESFINGLERTTRTDKE